MPLEISLNLLCYPQCVAPFPLWTHLWFYFPLALVDCCDCISHIFVE